MESDQLLTLIDAAGRLTVTAVLFIAVIAFVRGWLPTNGQLEELRKSEQRAWEQADKARQELVANNAVIERTTEALRDLMARGNRN